MIAFCFHAIAQELDVLKALQCLEYACAVRSIDKAGVYMTSVHFHRLIEEFRFDRFQVLPEPANTTAMCLDEVFALSYAFPDYIVRFSDLLDPSLGSTQRPYATISFDHSIFSMSRHVSLGDALSVCSGLSSFSMANGIGPIRMQGEGVFGDLLSVFSFTNLQLAVGQSTHTNLMLLDDIFRLASWNYPWLRRFDLALAQCLAAKRSPRTEWPVYKGPRPSCRNDEICCQFDSRASGDGTPEMSRRLIRLLFGDREVTILGGPRTQRYLGDGYRYKIGSLAFVCERLAACSMFAGADSGLAHIAGVLGTPGYVVNYTDFDPVYAFFRDYPSLKVIDRAILDAPGILIDLVET